MNRVFYICGAAPGRAYGNAVNFFIKAYVLVAIHAHFSVCSRYFLGDAFLPCMACFTTFIQQCTVEYSEAIATVSSEVEQLKERHEIAVLYLVTGCCFKRF